MSKKMFTILLTAVVSYLTAANAIAQPKFTEFPFANGGNNKVALFGEYNPDSNTVALYHFDDPSGSVVADTSGNGNTGAATGTTIVAGIFGKARSFNDSDYVYIPNAVTLNPTNAITVEAWVNTANSADGAIVSKYNHNTFLPSDQAYHLTIGGGSPGKIRWQIASGTNFSIVDGAIFVTDGNWHHIAGTYDGSTQKLYVDGILDAQKSFSGSLNEITFPLYLGATLSGGNRVAYFNGLIDEVRISNIARTDFPSGSTDDKINPMAKEFSLKQNYPNPFKQNTTINYQLPKAGKVGLKVYSITGQLLNTLVDGNQASGSHSIRWNGMNEQSQKAAAGVYIYRLSFDAKNLIQKLIYLK